MPLRFSGKGIIRRSVFTRENIMYEENDNPIRFFEGWAVIIALVVVGVAAVAIASALLLSWAAFGG